MPVDNGILVLKQGELFALLAEKIKGGAWGNQTVLDLPNEYAADPLVQLAVAITASDADCWLALEWLHNQLDPLTADARFIEAIHLPRLGVTQTGLSDAQARALYLALVAGSSIPDGAAAAAMSLPSVKFAKLITRKHYPPFKCHEAMLVVMPKTGQTIPAGAIAEVLYKRTEDGLVDYVGDVVDTHTVTAGVCYAYRYQLARRAVIGLKIYGNFDSCASVTFGEVANALIQKFNCEQQFNLGLSLTGVDIIRMICAVPGFTVNRVEVARIIKPLVTSDCFDDTEKFTFVDCDGVEVEETWGDQVICQFDPPAPQCRITYGKCADLRPWEYPTLHANWIEFINEATAC